MVKALKSHQRQQNAQSLQQTDAKLCLKILIHLQNSMKDPLVPSGKKKELEFGIFVSFGLLFSNLHCHMLQQRPLAQHLIRKCQDPLKNNLIIQDKTIFSEFLESNLRIYDNHHFGRCWEDKRSRKTDRSDRESFLVMISNHPSTHSTCVFFRHL